MTAAPRPSLEEIRKAADDFSKKADIPTLTYPSAKDNGQPPTNDNAPSANVTPLRKRVRKHDPAPVKRVSLDLPARLTKDIAKRALEEECTIRFIYLQAFRAIGFQINDIDYQQDGRRNVQHDAA